MVRKNNLFIGAHPDDVVISCANLIQRSECSNYYVLITNGATRFPQDYPLETNPGLVYPTPEEYSSVRLREDFNVMSKLGLTQNNIFSFGFFDQETYQHIKQIVDKLKNVISDVEPSRIYTHSFPEAHPDHEVACFCTHQAVKELNLTDRIEIYEYPMYIIPSDSERINRRFVGYDNSEILVNQLSEEEKRRKEGLFLLYKSQPDITERYSTAFEQFRLSKRGERDFQGVSGYIQPWITEVTPDIIRCAIKHNIGGLQNE